VQLGQGADLFGQGGDLHFIDSRMTRVSPSSDALRTIAAFRLALPRTVLRYAGGRELALWDLGTEAGMLGGINAIIVGNYLTTPRAARSGRSGDAQPSADADKGAFRHSLIARASAAIPSRAPGVEIFPYFSGTTIARDDPWSHHRRQNATYVASRPPAMWPAGA
jgi:hypothetical protein